MKPYWSEISFKCSKFSSGSPSSLEEQSILLLHKWPPRNTDKVTGFHSLFSLGFFSLAYSKSKNAKNHLLYKSLHNTTQVFTKCCLYLPCEWTFHQIHPVCWPINQQKPSCEWHQVLLRDADYPTTARSRDQLLWPPTNNDNVKNCSLNSPCPTLTLLWKLLPWGNSVVGLEQGLTCAALEARPLVFWDLITSKQPENRKLLGTLAWTCIACQKQAASGWLGFFGDRSEETGKKSTQRAEPPAEPRYLREFPETDCSQKIMNISIDQESRLRFGLQPCCPRGAGGIPSTAARRYESSAVKCSACQLTEAIAAHSWKRDVYFIDTEHSDYLISLTINVQYSNMTKVKDHLWCINIRFLLCSAHFTVNVQA